MEQVNDYKLAALEVKDLLQKKFGSHLDWGDQQFLAKVLKQYPRRKFRAFLECIPPPFSHKWGPWGLRRKELIPLMDYSNWVVYSEKLAWEDSVDSMGPSGLDRGARFQDFHEWRRDFYTSSR